MLGLLASRCSGFQAFGRLGLGGLGACGNPEVSGTKASSFDEEDIEQLQRHRVVAVRPRLSSFSLLHSQYVPQQSLNGARESLTQPLDAKGMAP